MEDSKKSAHDPKVRLQPIELPKSLRDAARRKSVHTGVSVSFVVRKSLEKWVKGELELDGAEK